MPKVNLKKPIKYADKSEGQPVMQIIFDKLKKMISQYVKGNFLVRAEGAGNYSIYYDKEVIISKRKFPELAFATILIQKGYVGFYFFPIYTNPKLISKLPGGLLKCLEGKTCFHIKKDAPRIMSEVEEVLEIGFAYYQSKGWK